MMRRTITSASVLIAALTLSFSAHAQTKAVPAIAQSNGFDSLHYSNDGEWLASGGGDGTVAIWDLKTGRIIRRFSGGTKSADTVSISPDRTMAAGISDTIRIWKTADGAVLHEFDRLAINHMAMSPDWQHIAVDGSEFQGTKYVYLVKIAKSSDGSVERKLSGHTDSINKMIYSADGRFLVSASSDKTARLWDPASGKLLRTFSGHQADVKAIAISGDGRYVVTGSKDKTVRIWNAATGNLETTISGSENDIDAVAVSPDGRLVAAVSDRVSVFDRQSGQVIWKGEEYSGGKDLRFSPDGSRLAVGAYESIVVRDARNGNVLQKLEAKVEAATPVVFAIDGSSLVADGRVLRKWDLVGGRLALQSNQETNLSSVIAVSPDQKMIATASYEGIAIWDAGTGSLLKTFDKMSTYINALAFSPDGKWLISGGEKIIRIWNVQSGKFTRSVSVSSQFGVHSLALSPDGQTIAVSTLDSLRLYGFSTGALVKTFQRKQGDAYYSIAFAPNGRWLATGGFMTCSALAGCFGSDRTQWGAIKLWDIASGQSIRTMDDYRDRVEAIAVSSDSSVVVGVANDNTIKVWETASGRFIRSLTGNATTVKSLSVSRDGDRIAGGSESEVKIWNSLTGEVLASFVSSKQGEWAVITPEGFFNASTNGAELLYVIDGVRTASIDQLYRALYRPDLVREKLAGDPKGKVKAAAAQLDLEKVMASGSPPRVAITAPLSESVITVDEVDVEVAISDQGGGVGKVEWRVNGVTLGLEARGFERIGGAGTISTVQTVKRKLGLERGDNRIEVVAYNAKNLIASEPVQVSVRWDGERTASPPKLYVLAVGVNDYYDSRLRLAYAVPDATALADGLRKAGAGLYAGVEVKTVLDAEVTLANLDKVFGEIGSKVQPRDVFVFFLAGHGKTRNGRYYFLPRDFRYEDESSIEKAGMDQDRFQAWFAKIPARKSILLYDTCESGSLTGNTRGSDIDERLGALNRMARATGRTFLTATTDDAPALEGYRGHGVFTYALLDALNHADVNNNGLIEVSELADYIDRKVPDMSFEAFKLRQIPQRSIVGNNFALTNRVAVLSGPVPGGNATRPAQSSGFAASPSLTETAFKPTHVVIVPVDVKAAAEETSSTVMQLAPGAQIRFVNGQNGWVLIERDGKRIGYVQARAIVGLQ